MFPDVKLTDGEEVVVMATAYLQSLTEVIKKAQSSKT